MAQPTAGSVPIRSTFADDPDMQELVRWFVSEMPGRVREIRESWSERRAADLERLAHQLKGASAGYGFACLGEAAARLERSLKSGAGLPEVRGQVEGLIEMCGRITP